MSPLDWLQSTMFPEKPGRSGGMFPHLAHNLRGDRTLSTFNNNRPPRSGGPPVLLRRQSRPAPTHGPSAAPRLPVAPAVKSVPSPKATVTKSAPAVKSTKSVGPAPVVKPVPAAKPVPTPKKLSLPHCGAQLPVTPLQNTDVPPTAPVLLGRLVRAVNDRTGRPLIMISVPCTCKKEAHRYAWRADWAVDTSVRSHQESRSAKHGRLDAGVWLALDPSRLSDSLQAVQTGGVAFLVWQAWWVKLLPSERTRSSQAAPSPGPWLPARRQNHEHADHRDHHRLRKDEAVRK